MASAKRQIENEGELEQIEPKEQVNITDVNEDCLVMIFGHLDFPSLVNVGISSPFLLDAAKVALHRKYGGINKKPIYCFVAGNYINWYQGTVYVRGFKQCLQFLRCFGEDISYLKVDYNVYKHSARIDQYIGKYCGDRLTSLNMICSPAALVNIEEPFNSLQNLSIDRCKLGQQLMRLSTLFPKIRSLKIVLSSGIGRVRGINTHFPQLEHISVGIDYKNRSVGLSQQNLSMILHDNPQLCSLEIAIPEQQGMSFEKFLNMVRENKSLTKLVITIDFSSYKANENKVKQFAAALPALIELDIRRYRLTSQDALYLINQLPALQHFTFQLHDKSTYRGFIGRLSQWQSNKFGVRNYMHRSTASRYWREKPCDISLTRTAF